MPEDTGGWNPVDHACRFCGGRIMTKGTEFQCFHCGAQTTVGVTAICGCGLSAGARIFPFRCTPNQSPGPANPALIVIARAAPQRRLAGGKP